MTGLPGSVLDDLAGDLLAAVEDSMTAYGRTSFARSTVTPGEAVWDDCCAGQLSVWVDSLYPVGVFPSQQSRPDQCYPPGTIGVVLMVETLRCAPVMDANGIPPTSTALAAAALQLLTDGFVAYRAMVCFGETLSDDGYGILVGATTFPPTSGGCMASHTRITVEVDASCICDAPA